MRITYTVHKIHCIHGHAYVAILSSLRLYRRADVLPNSVSWTKPLFKPRQKLALKVGVANTIKTLIIKNLRKRLALVETMYNKVSLQK